MTMPYFIGLAISPVILAERPEFGQLTRRQIASRHDPRLKSFRNRLQNKGKPTKVAITATARKRVTILNAMLKQDQDYVASEA